MITLSFVSEGGNYGYEAIRKPSQQIFMSEELKIDYHIQFQ